MQGQPFTLNIKATGTNALLAEFVDFDGVMLLANGDPCSNCSLTIYSNPITTMTDENGNYSLTDVPVGRHTMVVSKNDVEILNDSFVIKTANDLTYDENTVKTNLNKFYMNINITPDKSLGQVVTSNETIPVINTMARELRKLSETNTSELRVINQPATAQTTASTEYRYYGATPNNYVWYNCKDTDNNGVTYGNENYDYSTTNCELWRIIGVFEVETPIYTNGNITSYKKENRVKIIKSETIGNVAWDRSDAGENSGRGANAWQVANLKNTLNATALSSNARKLINEAKYYLGGHAIDKGMVDATTGELYIAERSLNFNKVCSASTVCDDNIERVASWTGYFGLMYPSDYGYAAGSGCDSFKLKSYNGTCKNTDWLYRGGYSWTITPDLNVTEASLVYVIGANGAVYSHNANSANGVLPVLYLASDVVIKDGNGTSAKPFVINM